MSRKQKELRVDCLAYLSTEGDPEKAEIFENRQARYIHEYARAHNVNVVGIIRRNALGMSAVNRQFRQMAEMITHKKVDGVIAANMALVSKDMEDGDRKVGMICAAGGVMITVDEGRLGMNIKEAV